VWNGDEHPRSTADSLEEFLCFDKTTSCKTSFFSISIN